MIILAERSYSNLVARANSKTKPFLNRKTAKNQPWSNKGLLFPS